MEALMETLRIPAKIGSCPLPTPPALEDSKNMMEYLTARTRYFEELGKIMKAVGQATGINKVANLARIPRILPSFL